MARWQKNYVSCDVGDRPIAATTCDLDGDLDLDLSVVNRDSFNVSVLLNNGDGTFAEDVSYSVGPQPAFVATGDLDGDLDLDMVVALSGGIHVSVLINALAQFSAT